MAAQYKTRCPHCQAQFRIGEEHLRQAKGQVRCGSCLKVFLATENLVGGPSPEKPSSATPAKQVAPRPAGQPEASPEKWQMPDEERDTDAGSRWTLGDEADTGKAPEPPATKSPEDDDEKNETRLNLGGLELSDSFLSIDRDNDDERLRDDDFSDLAGVASGGSSSTTDESWAEQLLEELEDEPDARPEPAPAPRPVAADSAPKQKDKNSRQGPDPRRGKHHPRAMRERDEWMQDIEPEPEPFGTDAESLLDSLPEEDLSVLDLDRERDRSPRNGIGEFIRWSLASVALLALLGVQHLIFEFEDLARRPALRPMYAALCERLPCELPALSDVRSLRASNLVVRPHPDANGALMVDLLLHNDGTYAQPWPDLELGFTSLEGSPVASRRFPPTEYLKGDVASVERMPVGTPVHVSLEIVDPGERAVNYTLRPLPPGDSDRG